MPGDPQPDDLKAYSEKSDKDYDPLKDPSIDQSLLGHTYQVVMPMTVTKVKDGHTVENTATQVTNDRRDKTNTVTNPLKEINPTKDVTVKVGGDSIDGKSVYLNHTFLYRLDSSILPPDRATRPSRTGAARTSWPPSTTSTWATGPSTPAATCTGTARCSRPRARRSRAAASTPRSSAATCSPWTPTTTARSRPTRPRPTSTS